MALLDVLRAGVKVADGITKSFQGQVEYHRYVGQTGTGTKTYVPPLGTQTIFLDAIVDLSSKIVRSQSGELVQCSASILLLNVAQVVEATGGAGVSDEDVFILPNGQTGPVVALKGFMDAGTSQPVAVEVYLG